MPEKREKNFWKSKNLNPGLLGGKQARYTFHHCLSGVKEIAATFDCPIHAFDSLREQHFGPLYAIKFYKRENW